MPIPQVLPVTGIKHELRLAREEAQMLANHLEHTRLKDHNGVQRLRQLRQRIANLEQMLKPNPGRT